MKKKILIIGAGGREHALGWKIQKSPHAECIYFAPGNAGTQKIGENIPIAADDILSLLQFAKDKKINLTLVGPELPLSLGIVDEFTKHGLAVFGPTKNAARLETSKAWAVAFMQRHNIPHPKSYIFHNYQSARSHITHSSWDSFVIKADGLAAGKGVFVCMSKREALDAAHTLMKERQFQEAGDTIVIQEKLDGYEISAIAVADGKTAVPLLPAQDHKRAYNGDRGPNTGGMGAYTPIPFVSQELLEEINTKILVPTIQGMAREGNPYKGTIYPGLMITKQGPKVIEYNVRFGDPETQPQMMLLTSDLIEVINTCIEGELDPTSLSFKKGSALCVTLAAKGYPKSYKKGVAIRGLSTNQSTDVEIFHAGTAIKSGKVVTNGGRVLSVMAYGETLKLAHTNAYKAIGAHGVRFEGMEYRTDIARQALSYTHD